MDSLTLNTIAMLQKAAVAEDVFGALTGNDDDKLDAVKRVYRQLARVIHPDLADAAHKAEAQEAFADLGQFKSEADEAIRTGTYGKPEARVAPADIVVRSKKRAYIIGQPLASDDVADSYNCCYDDKSGVFKVARNPGDGDLLENESRVLRHLRTPDRPEAVGFFPYFPEVIDTFRFRENGNGPRRTANVFAAQPGYYSLAEVAKAYPYGITPRHMAWMWRQLLFALGYVHARKVIHGAVLLPNVLIHPEGHDLALVNWYAAVQDPKATKAHIPLMNAQFESWYPPEVPGRKTPTPGTDILMSARCMVALMGGDPATGNLSAHAGGEVVPRRLQGFLKWCLLTLPRERPQDAWQVRDEFTNLIEQLWGPRKRLHFAMPTR